MGFTGNVYAPHPPEPVLWHTTTFARSVVEIGGYIDRIHVRQEVVDFAISQRFQLTPPPRRLKGILSRKWSAEDRKIIYSAAQKYWVEWRANAERTLTEAHERNKKACVLVTSI